MIQGGGRTGEILEFGVAVFSDARVGRSAGRAGGEAKSTSARQRVLCKYLHVERRRVRRTTSLPEQWKMIEVGRPG